MGPIILTNSVRCSSTRCIVRSTSTAPSLICCDTGYATTNALPSGFSCFERFSGGGWLIEQYTGGTTVAQLITFLQSAFIYTGLRRLRFCSNQQILNCCCGVPTSQVTRLYNTCTNQMRLFASANRIVVIWVSITLGLLFILSFWWFFQPVKETFAWRCKLPPDALSPT
jgi:hypothetical protein